MDPLEEIIQTYRELNLSDIIDYDKFNQITISHHSTRLEGSTLTKLESEILLNNLRTPKGKLMEEVDMVRDHANALKFVLEQASEKKKITLDLIQKVNARVLKNTGEVLNNVFGTFDLSQGVLRKWNVQNGSGDSYPNFDKVEDRIRDLVRVVNDKMKDNLTILEATNLAFDMHYNLVALHPFGNGNGRTSRLMMNYIQVYYNLPMAIVNSEDKADYIAALRNTDQTGDKKFFNEFMHNQYKKYLVEIIDKHNQENTTIRKRGFGFLF